MEYRVHRLPHSQDLSLDWDGPHWRDIPSLPIDQFHPQSTDHRPATRAKLAMRGRRLHVLFNVGDRYVRSVHTNRQDQVCRDSCVEMFVEPVEGKGYFNFEFNCGGAMLLYHIADPAIGPDGQFKQYTIPPQEQLLPIEVRATLPEQTPIEIETPLTWRLAAAIPLEVMERYVGLLSVEQGTTWRANFFKCGDDTSHPHWASWSPIGEKLSFHQPDRFGVLRF